jgi:hypothetical protein
MCRLQTQEIWKDTSKIFSKFNLTYHIFHRIGYAVLQELNNNTLNAFSVNY